MHALGASKVWRHEAQGRLDLLGEFTYYKPGTALSAASTNLDDRVSDGNAKH
jgi:galactokinase